MPLYQPMAPITYWLLFMAAGFSTVLLLVLGFLCTYPDSKSDLSSPAFLTLEIEAVLANEGGQFRWTLDDWRSAEACFEHAFEQAICNDHDLLVLLPDAGRDQFTLTVTGFAEFGPTLVPIGQGKSNDRATRSQSPISLDDKSTDLQYRLWKQTFCSCMEQDPSILIPLSGCTLDAFLDSAKDYLSTLGATSKGPSSVLEYCLVHSYQTAFPTETGILPSLPSLTHEFTDELASMSTTIPQSSPSATPKPMTANQLRRNEGLAHSIRQNFVLSYLSLSKLWTMPSESAVEGLFCDCFRHSSGEGANGKTCQVQIKPRLL